MYEPEDKIKSGSLMEVVSVDIMGSLPTRPKRKRFIISFTDCGIQFMILVPMHEYFVETINQVLNEEVIPYFGPPLCIQSNQGHKFTGHTWKGPLNILGTHQVICKEKP